MGTAPKQRRRTISDPIAPRPAGPGGDLARFAGDALSAFSADMGKLADKAAARAGEAEGAKAGLDPEFRPERSGTIRGDARDRSALRVMAVRLEDDIATGLAAAYKETGHDPAAFAERAQALRSELINTLPHEIQPDLAAYFQRQRFGYDRDIARRVEAARVEADNAAAQSWLAQRQTEIGRTAWQGGLDEQSDEVLAAEVARVEASLLELGPKEAFTYMGRDFAADDGRAGIYGLDDIEAALRGLGGEIADNRIRGAFTRASGLSARMEFLDQFREDFESGAGVAGKLAPEEMAKLEGWMETAIRQELAEQRSAAALVRSQVVDIRSRLTDYRSFARDGLTPDPAAIAQLHAEARATGDSAIIGEVEALAGLSELAGMAAQADPATLQAAIHQRRSAVAGGATPQQAAEIGMLEDVLAGMSTALKRDPLSWGQRAGIVDAPPLDLSRAEDPQTGAPTDRLADGGASLAARRPAAHKVAQTYGVPFRPFTEEEGALLAQLDQRGGAELALLARDLVQTMGADAGEALEQVSDRAPLFAHLGGLLATGAAPETIQDAARGRQLQAEASGNVKTLTATDKAITLQRQHIDEAVRLDPRFRVTLEQTADAIYYGRKGLAGSFDGEAYERALQEAMGATYAGGVRYGGTARASNGWQLAPQWLRADRLDDVIRSLDADALLYAGGGFSPVDETGAPIPPRDARAGTFVSVGPGQYMIAMGDPDGEDPQWLASMDPHSDGRYVLDLNRLRNEIGLRNQWVAP